ncbi:hypothetical protein CHE218_09110 [Microbacterium sp. che218]
MLAPRVDNQPGRVAAEAVGAATTPDARSTSAAVIAETRRADRRSVAHRARHPDIGTPAVIVAVPGAAPRTREGPASRHPETRSHQRRFPSCFRM